jgi:hypothetical protein
MICEWGEPGGRGSHTQTPKIQKSRLGRKDRKQSHVGKARASRERQEAAIVKGVVLG